MKLLKFEQFVITEMADENTSPKKVKISYKNYNDEFENKKKWGKIFGNIVDTISNILSGAKSTGTVSPKQKDLLDKWLYGKPKDYGTKN